MNGISRTKMTKKIPTLLFILVFSQVHSLFGQLVKDKFDKMNLSENFDSSSSMWTMVANLDNLFIVQEGEYILSRKTLLSPFAVIASYASESSTFRLVSSIKLEKSQNDEGSAGLIFMAQEDGTGGFIFEFNKLRQYRVKQISNGSYRNVTGDSKSNGWVRSNTLSETGLFNLIDIRTSNKNYDIYVNNAILVSFSESAYTKGKLGIIIGPGSKARCDFFYIFTSSKSSNTIDDALAPGINSGADNAQSGGPDIIALAESIIQLKTQINKLNEENEMLHQTIEAYKSESKNTAMNEKIYEKNISTLQEELKRQNQKMDSLNKANVELLKYKELVAGNENSDLIITLSKAVKNEKASNEELRRINKELSDSLSVLKRETDHLDTGKSNKSGNSNSPVKTIPDSTNKKGFILPADGK